MNRPLLGFARASTGYFDHEVNPVNGLSACGGPELTEGGLVANRAASDYRETD